MMVPDASVLQVYQDLKKLFSHGDQKGPVDGETWYLISSIWFRQLRIFLGIGDQASSDLTFEATAHPGPIDNTHLYDPDTKCFKECLVEEIDYVVVTADEWKALYETFKMTEGQHPESRKAIDQGRFVKHCKIEIYLLEFHLAENSKPLDIVKRKFSKVDSVVTISDTMRDLFGVDPSVETRIWTKYSQHTYELISNLDVTVQDAGLYTGQVILIEQRQPDGTWQRTARSTSSALGSRQEPTSSAASEDVAQAASSSPVERCTALVPVSNKTPRDRDYNQTNSTASAAPAPHVAPSPSMSTRYSYNSLNDGASDKLKPGLCGLSNLGNTCFMNSIIQGLSNTPPIMEYFANDNYVEDINDSNPLGMQGEIARSFGELIKTMWSGKVSHYAPRNFKQAVGRFAPQFSGYQQQDSHELLSFLLDGLHEDLNRIKKKPYIALTDSGNRPDDDVARETWEIYKARNDSVILDLFHGLLKSTVVCPECNKISVTFDPFCHLSLPLPIKKDRQIELFMVYKDPTRCPVQFKVTVPKAGNMKDLAAAASQASGVDSDNLVITDVYNHRFHKIYNPEDLLSQILDRDDIFIFEVGPDDQCTDETALVPIYLRERKSQDQYVPANLFGQPMIMSLPKNSLTYQELYDYLLKRMSRFISAPSPGDIWWKTPPKEKAVNGNGTSTAQSSNDSEDDAKGDQMDCASADSVENAGDEELMGDEELIKDGRGPPLIFALNFVNSYGNSVLEAIGNNGKPITFVSCKNYLALDFHPVAKKLFYNEKRAEDMSRDESTQIKASPKKMSVKLVDCLELYTSKEKLSENDAWYCPRCKAHQQATKKFDLWSLPSVLVISLKRFSFNRYWRDKLDTHVDFPTRNLDMSPYVINPNHGQAVYDLIAVSNHYGGMGGGHYTAYAKNQNDGKWYHFDDAMVTAIDEEGVVTKAAYVLFYQRRDLTRLVPSSTITSATVTNGMKTNGEASSEEEMDTTN